MDTVKTMEIQSKKNPTCQQYKLKAHMCYVYEVKNVSYVTALDRKHSS